MMRSTIFCGSTCFYGIYDSEVDMCSPFLAVGRRSSKKFGMSQRMTLHMRAYTAIPRMRIDWLGDYAASEISVVLDYGPCIV
ncbi:unnamed protein product [Strongylus vulgaris]|uniref:Uncharacterized protein n=1 Tax=Strongylus vulgaris TaxID=40348 RepID=A0A3P7IKX8_STRVU|nr:unnamed protein product [Strongylus vulgaris]